MPESSRLAPSCLVLHGLGGGPYELAPLTDALRSQGLRVEAPTLPGHESASHIMPDSVWTDWAAAARSSYHKLVSENPRVAVIGFSTGGTLALELAASESVDRLVLIAPFLAIRFSPLVPLPTENWLGLIAHWIPHLPRRSPAVRDRAMRHWAAQQDRFRTFSLRATMSALALIDRVKGLLPAIQAPSLILQGKKDMVVEPAQAQWLFDQLGSKEKKLLWFEDSDHLVALDHERERAIEAVIEFLQTPCEDSPQ